ncbi:hypothetical protein B0H14DRAFT_1154604, partial [Mycena olivaceomarginata]
TFSLASWPHPRARPYTCHVGPLRLQQPALRLVLVRSHARRHSCAAAIRPAGGVPRNPPGRTVPRPSVSPSSGCLVYSLTSSSAPLHPITSTSAPTSFKPPPAPLLVLHLRKTVKGVILFPLSPTSTSCVTSTSSCRRSPSTPRPLSPLRVASVDGGDEAGGEGEGTPWYHSCTAALRLAGGVPRIPSGGTVPTPSVSPSSRSGWMVRSPTSSSAPLHPITSTSAPTNLKPHLLRSSSSTRRKW